MSAKKTRLDVADCCGLMCLLPQRAVWRWWNDISPNNTFLTERVPFDFSLYTTGSDQVEGNLDEVTNALEEDIDGNTIVSSHDSSELESHNKGITSPNKIFQFYRCLLTGKALSLCPVR